MEWRVELSQYVCGGTVDGASRKIRTGAFECPSFKNATSDATYDGGYGWNYNYLGLSDVHATLKRIKIQQVEQPSNTIMFGDTADNWGGSNYFMVARLYGSISSNGIYSRHNQKANVAWIDGHVTTEQSNKLSNGTSTSKDWYYLKEKTP